MHTGLPEGMAEFELHIPAAKKMHRPMAAVLVS